MEAFYEYYHAAGAELCSFYESSPEAIETKLDGLLETLKVQPIVVSPSQEENGPLVPQKVSYSAVKRLVSAMLYQPYFERPTFSDILTGLDKGNSCPYYNHYNPTVALSPVCGSATFEESIEDAEYLIDWSPAPALSIGVKAYGVLDVQSDPSGDSRVLGITYAPKPLSRSRQ